MVGVCGDDSEYSHRPCAAVDLSKEDEGWLCRHLETEYQHCKEEDGDRYKLLDEKDDPASGSWRVALSTAVVVGQRT